MHTHKENIKEILLLVCAGFNFTTTLARIANSNPDIHENDLQGVEDAVVSIKVLAKKLL